MIFCWQTPGNNFSFIISNYIYKMYLFILQTVRSIEDPEKNPKAVDNWIDSIRCDHNIC